MNSYHPDRWVIVEVNSPEHGKIRKVLASWYGGYAVSDEWRLSSGITQIVESDMYYLVKNESGSLYTCYKNRKGMSAYASSVFENYKKKLEESNMGTIEIVEINA